ncbi:zinc finger protein 830 [Trichomycterus rosablanca]|uniref:zinc finger protein 830 n=1 Tax=Trichomycterus rosablanca TaxID=2290929 RepID=UPI002F3558DC
MASKGGKGKKVGKKVVNQEELRRLMREKKQCGERQKRVDSPLAKYSAAGGLSCAVCNVPVKSDILWNTHILSKQHRDKVCELKTSKHGPVPPAPKPSLKRKTTQAVVEDSKKSRTPAPGTGAPGSGTAGGSGSGSAPGLPTDFFQSKAGTGGKSAGLGLLAGQYDEDDDEEQEEDEDQKKKDLGAAANNESKPAEGLPADFFDSGIPAAPGVSHSGSVTKAEEERPAERRDGAAETLPEGFFDDPVRDAKVRNVDTPKDHMDKEWEEFQKEMRQVNTASEAIVAEEDEEGRIGRQIDEIDEQIECFRRVEVLRSKREAIKEKVKTEVLEEEQQASGGDEEEDEEELLHVLARDWRAKGALV